MLTTLFLLFFLGSVSFAQATMLRIVEKPTPILTAAQRHANVCVQGTVLLKVEVLGTGEIGKIVPVRDLPHGLTENAIDAATKISFKPMIVDGKPITTFRTVDYSFYNGWNPARRNPEKPEETKQADQAEAVIKKAIQNVGGEKYLQVRTQIGRGKFSIIRDGGVISFQTFLDVIVFPDKERTEFKGGGTKTIQANNGTTGWVFDGDVQRVKDQDDAQIQNFKRGIRTSLDNLLRGHWRGEATLAYVGRRPATLGKRNDVIKLTYNDGLIVEFEFAADDGLPAKAIYKRIGPDNEEIKEEDRYAQFIDVNGIRAPFIIDRFTNGAQTSRINYESIEYNRSVPDSIFGKPSSAKELKKDLKL